MRPYDIYYAAVRWIDCPDERPWLIVEARGREYVCFPLSGQCYRGRDCFSLDPEHPDFPATGLAKGCYIHYESSYELAPDQFTRRVGELTGELLRQFLDAAGF